MKRIATLGFAVVALDGSLPPDDAFITRKLREAGAIILGKATLTEFANFIALGMPTGYSSLGGFGFNPYDPRPLPGGDGRPVLQTGLITSEELVRM